jgi:hypothetical protein
MISEDPTIDEVRSIHASHWRTYSPRWKGSENFQKFGTGERNCSRWACMVVGTHDTSEEERDAQAQHTSTNPTRLWGTPSRCTVFLVCPVSRMDSQNENSSTNKLQSAKSLQREEKKPLTLTIQNLNYNVKGLQNIVLTRQLTRVVMIDKTLITVNNIYRMGLRSTCAGLCFGSSLPTDLQPARQHGLYIHNLNHKLNMF